MKVGKVILKAACWDPHKWVITDKSGKHYKGGYRFIWYRCWILAFMPLLFWIDLLPKRNNVNRVSNDSTIVVIEKVDKEDRDKEESIIDELFKKYKHIRKGNIIGFTIYGVILLIPYLFALVSILTSEDMDNYMSNPSFIVPVIILCIEFYIGLPFIIVRSIKLNKVSRKIIKMGYRYSKKDNKLIKVDISIKDNGSTTRNKTQNMESSSKLKLDSNYNHYPDIDNSKDEEDNLDNEDDIDISEEERRDNALNKGWDEDEMDLDEFEDYNG